MPAQAPSKRARPRASASCKDDTAVGAAPKRVRTTALGEVSKRARSINTRLKCPPATMEAAHNSPIAADTHDPLAQEPHSSTKVVTNTQVVTKRAIPLRRSQRTACTNARTNARTDAVPLPERSPRAPPSLGASHPLLSGTSASVAADPMPRTLDSLNDFNSPNSQEGRAGILKRPTAAGARKRPPACGRGARNRSAGATGTQCTVTVRLDTGKSACGAGHNRGRDAGCITEPGTEQRARNGVEREAECGTDQRTRNGAEREPAYGTGCGEPNCGSARCMCGICTSIVYQSSSFTCAACKQHTVATAAKATPCVVTPCETILLCDKCFRDDL